MTRDELFFKQKNVYETANEAKVKEIYDFAEGYKTWLGASRTERLAVREAVKLAEAKGFKPWQPGKTHKAGEKLYFVNREKALTLAVLGKKSLGEGANIAAAHVDNPRLDLKQHPLYEDGEMAFFKTHYYGGIKKYQWVVTPLALVGVVVRGDGEKVDVSIGLDPGEPRFVITDLLPHLAADQMKKSAAEVIPGEGLNLLLGTRPDAEEGSDRVKLRVLKLLHEKYGITEADFLSAELCAVPADEVTDIGLDRSLIGGFGHDDRVCAYAELMAVLEAKKPEKTAVCLLVDKEEIGSVGATGITSRFFENTVAELMDLCGQLSDLGLRRCLANCNMLSSDVSAGFDPLYAAAFEAKNASFLVRGIVFNKFTGSRGKSGSNDANAEYMAKVRAIMDKDNVAFQTAELGRVDLGGGGTIAYILAEYGMNVIDAGVAVLSMHAPWETVSKADLYEALKAYKAFLKYA